MTEPHNVTTRQRPSRQIQQSAGHPPEQRKSEVSNARWSEFDLQRALWTIPPERMKADTPHTVPLTAETVAVLESLPRFQAGGHLFSTTLGKKPVSGFSKAKIRLDEFLSAELRKHIGELGIVYFEPWTIQCAPKARITSGGRFHPESCRLIW